MIYIYHIADRCGGFYPTIVSHAVITLSFFMSWFFFKGGMMHRVDTTKEIVKKSVKRLLVPYIAFGIIGFVLDGIIFFSNQTECGMMAFMGRQIDSFLRHTVMWSTAASWFLLSLFVARTIFNALCNKIHPLLLTTFFAFTAYCIYIANIYDVGFNLKIGAHNLYYNFPSHYMGTMCHGLSLYSLGYFLREKQFDSKILSISVIIFVLKYFILDGIDFKMNEPANNYLLAVLYGMAGCVVINNIFRRFVNVRIPLISYIGKNSMVYYLVHYRPIC